MSTWESAAESWAKSPGPNANPPATWGEIVAANARYGGLQTMSGAGAMQEQAYRELEQQLQTVTGQDAATFTEGWTSPQTSSKGEPFLNVDKAYVIGQHLDKLDKAKREAIAPYVDVTGRAAAAAQKATEEDQAAFARTYGIGGHGVEWATYLARQLVDPINLGSAIVTGAAGVGAPGVVSWLGREAVVGGAQAAVSAPLVAAERERLGLPNASFLESVGMGALLNVGFAVGGRALGAGIVGTLRGGAAVGRYLRGRGIEPPIHPDDALAVADAVETQNVMTEQAHPATPAARAAMPARIDRAGDALEGHGVKAEDPVAGGGADPTPARVGDLERQAATGAPPAEAPVLGPHQVEIGGKRFGVTYKLVDLKNLVVSHFMDGRPNPGYPAEAQPRNLATPASKGLVNEAAAHYRVNEALDQSESASIGPPIVTPKLVTMVGNRRLQMLARVYDRHPEHADAYRAGLVARGYDPTGMEFPVLVRELREDLTPAEMRFVGREGNVSPTGKMSAGERAFSDASLLGDELLALHRGGSVTSLANVPFVRAFVDRLVATTEREDFISKDNVVSLEGVRRVEAALVAKAYEAPDIVAGLFEVTEPSSRAILGGLADNAALAARVKSEIAAGRIDASLDPSPALVEAFRLVERARKSGQKVDLLASQIDLELGAVPSATLDALDYYFRDPPKSKAAKEAGVAYRVAAGRVAIAPQIELAMDTALSKANAAGDLLGLKADAGFALREGGTAEMPPGDLTAGEDLAAPPAETPAPAETAAAAAETLLKLERTDLYSPPAEGTTPEAAAILERARDGTLPERIRAGATREELAKHPDLVAADEYAASRTSTDKLPGYGTPEFWAGRVYKFEGETFVGLPAYVARLIEKARSYAKGTVRQERKATIVLGSPAAGKSSISEPHAVRIGAAIPDADDAKAGIDAFEGGLGAPATHKESTVIQSEVLKALSDKGDNLVLQKCGDWAPGVRDLINYLNAKGYQVDLINMSVDPDEAFRRMASRYLGKGRLIPIDAMLEIGNKSSDVYYILKEENLTNGTLHETIEVDANGAFGAERPILDGADTELAAGLRREELGHGGEPGAPEPGGTGSGRRDTAGGLAHTQAEKGPGGEVINRAGATPKSFWSYQSATETPAQPPPDVTATSLEWEGLSPGMRREVWRDYLRRNPPPEELAAAAPTAAPAKPLGDPQLAAEADSVIADVGEDFQIKLGEPGSDEVRTLSIAQARAEAAEVDAAAEELLACIAGATSVVAGAAGATVAAGGAAAAGAGAAP